MENTPVDLSIIIVAWNSEPWLRRCLRSIFTETSDLTYEIIVVDNASSDRSAQVAMNEFNNVQVIRNQANLGFATAVNQGLAGASGRYVCLLNPDTEITDHALARMVEAMDSDQSIGVMGPHILNENGSTQASVRRFPTGKDQAMILSKLHLLFPDTAALSRYLWRGFDYRRSQDVDQVMGACFMIRREVLDAIGPLDGKFFIWFEDVDYCLRVKEQTTYRIAYYSQAHVIHFGGDSFQKVSVGKKRRWYAKSVRYYFRKHKRWGAYAATIAVAPVSWAVGLASSLYALTPAGKRAMQAAAEVRKGV
ncbi:MAG: glycosyltransferase family 2 protein [Parcubacteria group bacterium]|nr:glycosyltransferase family 2 protein [Parcubacteria group bacterium]